MIGGYLLNDTVTVQTAQITVDVGNNLFLGFLLKDNLTTEWGVGEATLYLSLMLREWRPINDSKRSL